MAAADTVICSYLWLYGDLMLRYIWEFSTGSVWNWLFLCKPSLTLSNFDMQGGHFSGIYRKVQLKPLKWVKIPKSDGEGEEERPVEALMVLKYGGVLTHAGRKQVLPFSIRE